MNAKSLRYLFKRASVHSVGESYQAVSLLLRQARSPRKKLVDRRAANVPLRARYLRQPFSLPDQFPGPLDKWGNMGEHGVREHGVRLEFRIFPTRRMNLIHQFPDYCT